jgi:hypothetical protein
MPTFPADIIRKPEWKAIIAAEMAREQKREEARANRPAPKDDSAEWLKWVEEMHDAPGLFVPCELMPNWLNGSKVPVRFAQGIKKTQRRTAYAAVKGFCHLRPTPPPYVVTITRYGPSRMDDDGNAAALKYVRDGVARALGIDDGDEAQLTFKPRQQAAKFYGYRILIEGQ